MSDNDDIRRALEELSSHPPHRDRKQAVRARVGVVRRRHQITGGVAMSIVALLSAIAFASLGGRGAAPNDALLQTPSVTPTPAPSPAPSPRSSAAVAAIAKAPRVKPPGNPAASVRTLSGQSAGSASASSTPAAATPGKNVVTSTATVTIYATPPSPVPPLTSKAVVSVSPSSSSPTSAASTPAPSGGSATTAAGETLSADIGAATINDGSPAPETVVTVRLHGTIAGSIGSVMAWYTTVHHVGYTDSQARACTVGDGKLHDVDDTFTFRTRYRAAGAQTIAVNATTLDPTCAAGAPKRDWPFASTVQVPVGSSLSNGVAPTTVVVGAAHVQDSRITLSADADDPDGYVSGFTINWGTGPPDPFPGGNGANCSASEYGGVFWPSGGGSGTFTSPILPAGTYTVTVTATATGCDGSDPQTAVQKLTVTVP